jgi:hypothetical protein
MPSQRRAALTSVVGWVIVALVVFWMFGLLIGWIRFVLRSVVWFVLIGLLLAAYLAIREPPDA